MPPIEIHRIRVFVSPELYTWIINRSTNDRDPSVSSTILRMLELGVKGYDDLNIHKSRRNVNTMPVFLHLPLDLYDRLTAISDVLSSNISETIRSLLMWSLLNTSTPPAVEIGRIPEPGRLDYIPLHTATTDGEISNEEQLSSIEAKIRMGNPDWSDEQVRERVNTVRKLLEEGN